VRARVRELNAEAVHYYAQLLNFEGTEEQASPEPLFMHIAVIGLCEFFAAAQAMILPLAPKHFDAKSLTEAYGKFIRHLILDGVRSRVEAPARIKDDA
jgi:hypothetical protein